MGDPSSIPGMGRFPGEGNGNPPQCFCLENPMDMDGGAWRATVHTVAKSQKQLSNFTFNKLTKSLHTRTETEQKDPNFTEVIEK